MVSSIFWCDVDTITLAMRNQGRPGQGQVRGLVAARVLQGAHVALADGAVPSGWDRISRPSTRGRG